RHTALYRCAARLAGHAHDTCDGLQREVEAAFLRTRTILAEGRHRNHDDIWLLGSKRLIVERIPRHGARPIVLDDDVAAQRERTRGQPVALLFQIEHDGALVAVHRRKILAIAAGSRRPLAHTVALRPFDLYDVRAHIGQQHAAERPCRDFTELRDS